VPYHFVAQLGSPRVTSLSIALVSDHPFLPPDLSGLDARLVWEPQDIRLNDDVVLFHGRGMAPELGRFAEATQGALPPALVLAPWLDWNDVSLALDHGATSYLLENRYVFLLVEALLCTARGASMLDPVIAAEQVRIACGARMQAEVRQEALEGGSGSRAGVVAPGRLPQLSRREREVMDLLVSGLGVRELARALYLTEKTVRNYLSRIYGKLGVHRQAEAILCWLGHLDTQAADDVSVRRQPGAAGHL
jgi:DNA-binding NarL/FixJ family response regulator